MRRLIAGTAGHIDHGKSALVKALTGTDPDRLKEEKQRGITTDLGFARLELPEGIVSFIDVPGHERFVKNMLAGAHGVDLALLVVAADEGVKPQTAEHLDILRLLGIPEILIIISKLDLVDAARIESVAQRVRQLAADTPYAQAPHLALSAKRGDGLEALKKYLAEKLLRRAPAPATGNFRMAADRVFSISGAGTVVTGTAGDGTAAIGDELEIYPESLPGAGGGRLRVRAVEAHGDSAPQSAPRSRTALNLSPLAGTKLENFRRGAILATPGSLRDDEFHLAQVLLLKETPPLKDLTQVNLYHLAAEFTARVRLLGGRKSLAPGETGWVQLWLDAPRPLPSGDRLVLRRISPPLTWGGAIVLAPSLKASRSEPPPDAAPDRHGRFTPGAAISAALKYLPIATPREIAIALGKTVEEVQNALPGLSGTGVIRRLGEAAALTGTLALREKALISALAKLHDKFPDAPGFTLAQLPAHLLHEGHLAHLAATGTIRLEAGRAGLPERGPKVDPAAARRRAEILECFEKAGLEGPDPQKLFTTPADKRLYEALLKDESLVRVKSDCAISAAAEGRLREFLAAHGRSGKMLSIADFKNALGLSRKWAVPLLEYCDMKHWTIRAGDARKILPAVKG